jgi:hypothetical protein
MKTRLGSWLVLILLAVVAAAPARAAEEKFSKQQLDQMLAPIALYPDDLLSNVLMAATYPLDVVEAQRWRAEPENAKREGDALADALKDKDWDPSIKALVQFPDVLKMMSDQLDWTQNLGDAFVAQQSEVMDEVQLLRSKADSSGHLKSNTQQTVTRQDDAYVIEPANPEIIYVPEYEPAVVYGSWWYPDYPPYYWGYPGAAFVNGYFWGAGGVAIAGGIWGWNHWDWRHRDIRVDVNKWNRINVNRNRITSNRWQHNAHHRGAVRPRNKAATAAERRRLNKQFHRAGRPNSNVKAANTNLKANVQNKAAARNPSRARHNKQFHSPKRKAAARPAVRARSSIAHKPAHVRKFNAPRGHARAHGGRRLRRR